MDKGHKEGKKKRRAKVGAMNHNFEMDAVGENNRPFLNNLKDAKPKQDNILEAILGAKQSVSKWKDFTNRKRIRKKTTPLARGFSFIKPPNDKNEGAIDESLGKTVGSLGLDDIHDDFKDNGQKIFGNDKRKSTMSSASNQALIQYFAKLGQSQTDDTLVDLDFIENLIRSGADVNCTDKHGQTLLHEVASKWHIDVAKFLIEMGAKVNQVDKFGRSPLHVAAADDYPAMIMVLIEHGADRECKTSGELQTPVHYAAKNDAGLALKALIKCDCEYKLIKDFKGRTPLHVAAELDRSETARTLLELEAPAGISDDQGQTILTWMITKMPPVALEALEQFHVRDRPNRKQLFYLNLLVHDTDKDPESFQRNALQVAVKYKQFDLLLHPVFIALIDTMWRRFGRLRAYWGIIWNFTYILLWTVYGTTVEVDERHEYKLPEHWWRIVLILAAVGITVWQIVDEIREYRRLQMVHEKYVESREKEIKADLAYCHPRWPEEEKFLLKELESLGDSNTRYFSDAWNIFDWICYILLIAVIGTHVADVVAHSLELARVHIRLTAVVIIFLWLRLMKNVRAFALLGPFVVMLGAMMADMLKFLFLYLEFYIPFVCAFWMLFGGSKYPENFNGNKNETEAISVDGFQDFGVTLFTLFRMTLVDEYPYEQMVEVDNVMAHLLTVTWLSISAILCLNLFIALLSDTFQRVYDNAKANAVMQKAQLIINFWDGLGDESKLKFQRYLHEDCSPKSEYYDDDMTEGADDDLKKVTIQIKEELDDLVEKWRDQFGDGDGKTALEELRGEDTMHKTKDDSRGKMITSAKFESEIDSLRDEIRNGMLELQKQQQSMNTKFKQDLKMVKSLLLDLTNGSGGGGSQGGAGESSVVQPMVLPGYFQPYGGTPLDSSRTQPGETGSFQSRSSKKSKQKTRTEEEPIFQAGLPGEIAFHPRVAPSPVVDVMTQDPFMADVYPSSRSTHDHDQSTA